MFKNPAFTVLFFVALLFVSCRDKTKVPAYTLATLDLKRGEIVSCGPQDGEMFGTVSFTASVPDSLKKDFNIAIALLHSFEYDEAEKMFARIIDAAPDCAMAYWGVAMSNFHPLWAPPSHEELEKGMKAIRVARSIKTKTNRESQYIEAIARFYENTDHLDHRSRVLNFKKATETIYQTNPEDMEAAVFYALALNAAADPADKTYSNQKAAVGILNRLFEKEPMHPGIAHYIIHNYDSPELAEMALPAARKYASIAPASAHAQHMPSHVFTRLGLWDECIQSNLVSVSSAKCYAEKANIKGHWDEELHGLDYLVYAYLQNGENELAAQQVNYLQTIHEVYPVNFKVAYAFAAVPARYALERKNLKEAAELKLHPVNFLWEKFSWQKAIIHFARFLGNIHLNKTNDAEKELDTLRSLYDNLSKEKTKTAEAAEVLIQVKAAEAWLQYKKGKHDKAVDMMRAAADMEDAMEKHPVTPGAVIPARELLGELLLQINKPYLALKEFELSLKKNPGRINGLKGKGIAAEKSGNRQ